MPHQPERRSNACTPAACGRASATGRHNRWQAAPSTQTSPRKDIGRREIHGADRQRTDNRRHARHAGQQSLHAPDVRRRPLPSPAIAVRARLSRQGRRAASAGRPSSPASVGRCRGRRLSLDRSCPRALQARRPRTVLRSRIDDADRRRRDATAKNAAVTTALGAARPSISRAHVDMTPTYLRRRMSHHRFSS